MEHEEKVVQWFTRMDWIQVGGRIAAILAITFVLVYIARRLIRGLEKFTALHALDVEAKKRAATVSNILSKLHLADRTQAAVYAWREGIVRKD